MLLEQCVRIGYDYCKIVYNLDWGNCLYIIGGCEEYRVKVKLI